VGNTPLHDAVEKGHFNIVAKLVDYGAPLVATNM
jgi:ankyrin repeat protein